MLLVLLLVLPLLVFLLRQRRAQRFGARMVDAEPEVSATEAAEMIDAKLARLRAVVEAREAEEALRDDGEE